MELAEILGVDEMTIVNWEVNDMTPCSRHLKRLARILAGLATDALATTVSGSPVQQNPATAPKDFAPLTPAHEFPLVKRFSGTIENVNEPGKTVSIKGKVNRQEKTLILAIDDKTTIIRAKKGLKIANLEKGMDVMVEYKQDGDKLIAVAIRVSAPKSKAKENAAPQRY